MNPNQFDEKRHSAMLRAEAEAKLALAPLLEEPAQSAEELLHELRVNQIELELQNEELRRAQIALEESRDRYLDLYAFAPVGYFTLSREGMISEVNLTGASFLGMERKKLLHTRFDSFVAPEDLDRWQHQFVSMVRHEIGRQKFELGLKRNGGSVCYGRLDCLRVELDGAPPVIRVTLTDIDELKHNENLLRASNERASLLLESTGEGIYAIDEMGLCTLANPACARLLGYATPEELLGRDMHRLMHYQHEDGSPYPVEECPAHNIVFSAATAHLREERFWRADGSSFAVELSAYPMRREGGVVGAVVSFNDITERKRVEEKLSLLNVTLEQRVREELEKNREKDFLLLQQSRLAAIGEVIHNVSHHWRQPLRAVSLILANIKDAYEFNELSQEYLDREVAGGQRLIHDMSSTIDYFRGFFAPDTEKRPFIVCDTVDEAIKLLDPAFQIGNVEIEFERCHKAHSVLGCPGDFSRVVLSVLTNARDAIIRKNIAGKIHIKAEKLEKTVNVSISDNGGGVPEKILNKIFDPYFTTHESGNGLGLYLAKMIMGNMGGTIVLRNAGKGAEVLLTLPLDAPDVEILSDK